MYLSTKIVSNEGAGRVKFTVLIDKAIKTRASRTAIEPEHYWISGWIALRFYKVIEQGPSVSLVHSDVPATLAPILLRYALHNWNSIQLKHRAHNFNSFQQDNLSTRFESISFTGFCEWNNLKLHKTKLIYAEVEPRPMQKSKCSHNTDHYI